MTDVYYGSSEKKLIPPIKADAILKHEGKTLGQDFNNPGKKKVQLRVVLQMDQGSEGGDRRYEKWLYFTPSLHVKSGLRKFLIEWRGEDFTEAQLEAFKKTPFNMSRLVGTCCRVRVIHETNANGDPKDVVKVIDQHTAPTFSVEWYADQKDKFRTDEREAEEFESSQRNKPHNGPRDEDDTTDYSEQPV